jgi:hypothetical protein
MARSQFTVSQAARELGTSYQRVQYAIAKGWLLTSRDDDGKVIIAKRQLDKYRKKRPWGLSRPKSAVGGAR